MKISEDEVVTLFKALPRTCHGGTEGNDGKWLTRAMIRTGWLPSTRSVNVIAAPASTVNNSKVCIRYNDNWLDSKHRHVGFGMMRDTEVILSANCLYETCLPMCSVIPDYHRTFWHVVETT
jgi:hypothetical protein